MTPRRRRVLAAAVVGTLALSSLACGDRVETAASSAAATVPGPLAGERLYVDSSSDAAGQERQWIAEDRLEDAKTIRAISRRPSALWLGEPDRNSTSVQTRVARLTARAAGVDRTPLIVIYSIPFRDCGSFSSGGSTSATRYRRYVKHIARGIGHRRALVVLEPDAVGHIADGCVSGRRATDRLALLRRAVATLKANGRTRVYLDAGNAGWISPQRIAPFLRRAGIARADGFAVNVANFQTVTASLAHGREISRRVGGKHLVVDTGRNGNGPWLGGGRDPWCNPPGRALGTPPTTKPGRPGVDAFLWIKHPGASDGTCRSGPPAGTWWPEYALALARAGH
jgi:endoglucanase